MKAFAMGLALVLPTAALGDGPAVRLPAGFRLTTYADETLADDIQAMTVDRHGRVVVTGPGYVKTLHEANGRASRAVVYAAPRSGGMGMCSLGDDLLITADNWLLRYRDADGDGVADGPPERIIPLATGEHGGHAIRIGPDGWIYVIGGNDAGIDERHILTSGLTVLRPEAGAIVRLSPDMRNREVVAHGFRNPYDFDFNSRGDLFTYDSDCERDEFLPWYTPTRAFHVAEGGHHGWRLKGYLRSFARTPDLFDTIPPLADLGRGSPTGVVCYRHDAFPARYRDGLFLADWTFGRIHFLPLERSADGYRGKAEVFLEPIGGDGFAPTDLAVAPDGALLVCIGGRKTRGSVYRVEYVGTNETTRADATDLDRVLHARQPLDAWSRERWVPIASRLGAGPFQILLKDEHASESDRVRAAEVLVELFGGFAPMVAEAAWESASPPLRARIAWAMERRPPHVERPARLVADEPDVAVAAALLSLAARDRLDAPEVAIQSGLSVPSPRIIPGLERALGTDRPSIRDRVQAGLRDAGPTSRLNDALVMLRRDGSKGAVSAAIDAALATLDTVAVGSPGPIEGAANAEVRVLLRDAVRRLRLDALRLIVIALGDWDLDHAEADAFVAYTTARRIDHVDVTGPILERVRKVFPSGDDRVDLEASRLLAMLGDDREATRRAVAARWSPNSTATDDLHYLIVYALLRSPCPADLSPRVAEALARLDAKLAGRPGRIKQTWNVRVGEVVARLAKSDLGLVDVLLARRDFATPNNAAWAARLGPTDRRRVASAFLEAAKADPKFEVSGPLLEVLDALPRDQIRPFLRGRWDDLADRGAALLRLADRPHAVDRARFLDGLGSTEPPVALASLGALEALPPSHEPADLVPALRLLRRLLDDPKAAPIQRRLASWIAREAGWPAPVGEHADLGKHYYIHYCEAFARLHPRLAAQVFPPVSEDWAAIAARVDWSAGDPSRGAEVFRARRCASCHQGAGALGPDLAGSSRRLARADLFAAIVAPGRDVAPAYRPVLVETADGRTVAGMLVFESADGLILRTGPAATERIDGRSIVARKTGMASLMPDGLLRDASEREIADLYAYLKSL